MLTKSENKKLAFSLLACALMAGTAMVSLTQTSQAETQNYVGYDRNGDGQMDLIQYFDEPYVVIDHDNARHLGQDEWTYYSRTWSDPYEDLGNVSNFDNSYYDTEGKPLELSEYERTVEPKTYRAWDEDGDGFMELEETQTIKESYTYYEEGGFYNFRD